MKPRVFCLIKGLGLGGAERLLCSGLLHRSRDEFDYEVGYLLPWKNALVPEIERQGVKVTCFEARSSCDPRAFRSIHRYLRRNAFDVLHAHLPVAGILGRIASRMCRIPAVVYTEHGMWTRLHPVTRLLNRVSLGLNDLTIAVSEDVAQSIPRSTAGRVVTVTNGVDSSRLLRQSAGWETVRSEFSIPEDHTLIGNVANFSPVKDHETLIRAFAQLQRQRPDVSLVLVGQWRGREREIRRLATDMGIADAVVLTGPRTDVPRLMHAFDIFSMSSRSEGLPISLLEAMSLGRPVVCTAVGGIPGAVTDGCEGFLVPPACPEALSQKLLQLVDAPDRRLQMGQTARERVSRDFEISITVRQIEQYYRSLLQVHTGSYQAR